MGGPWRNDTLLMQRCGSSRCNARQQLRMLNRRGSWRDAAIVALPWLVMILWSNLSIVIIWQLAMHTDWRPSFLVVLAITGIPFALLLLASFFWLVKRQRRLVLSHIETPRCFRCGYNLSGLTPHTSIIPCPECGNHSPVAPPSAPAP